MKKLKYLIVMLLMIPFVVLADDLDIVSMDMNEESAYGILYSNGKLFYHKESDTMYENVKKFNILGGNGKAIYLTNDNKLFDSNQLRDNIKDYVMIKNLEYSSSFYYIDNSDNLYYIIPGSYDNQLNNGVLKATNVKEALAINGQDTTILYLDNNNDLYFIGYNYFGTKINDGNPTDTPIKLLENIKYFSYLYAVDNNNNFYLFSSEDARPTVYASNVTKVVEDAHSKYFIGYSFDPIVVIHSDNSYELFSNEFKNKKIDIKPKKLLYKYLLSEDNKLYYYNDDNNKYDLIANDAVDIDLFYNNKWTSEEYFYGYINNKNEVYYLSSRYGYRYDYDNRGNEVESTLMKKLYQGNTYDKKLFFLKNVKSIKYAHKNLILLNDNTILSMDNDNQYHLLKQLNDTINNNKEFKTKQIYLSFKGIHDYTVGDEFDAFATVIPYNATNKELVWESSDTSVAEVNSEGYIKTKKVGQTTITVKTSDNSVSESSTITVHPKVSGIEFTNGSNIEIGVDNRVILEAKVSPDDTLEKDIIWEELDNENDNYYLSSYYYDDNGENNLKDNQKSFYPYKTGTYRVKVSTKNNKYSAIITINVIQKVRYIYYNIGNAYYDDDNVYMYLSESNKLQAKVIIEPENANNKNVKWSSSDTNIVEVSQDGLLTGKVEGTAKITIESIDGGAKRQFNVIVKNKSEDYYYDNDIVDYSYRLLQTNASTKSVNLKWYKNENANGYLVQVKNGKKWKTVSTIKNNNTVTATIKKLKAGKKYTYRVVAYQNVKKKKKTVKETINITDSIVAMTTPSAPKASIKSSAYDYVKVGYKKVTGGSYYILTRSTSKNGLYTKVANISGTYTDTDVKTGTTYYYKVKACNEKGYCSGDSKVVSSKPSLSKPSLKVKSPSKGKIAITSSKMTGADGYVIEMSTKKKKGFGEIANLNTDTTYYEDEEYKSKKTFYFRIRTYRMVDGVAVYSGWSKTQKVKVK